MVAADVASVAARLNIATSPTIRTDGVPEPEFDDEEVACTCPDVSFIFGESLDAGLGTLFVTTRRVVWVKSSGQQPPLALALRYPQVVMHAISRDTSAYARPCLYLQLDEGSEDMQAQGGEDEGAEDDEDEVLAEVRLVPANEAKVELVFKALCDSAALNPDEDGEESGEGEFFYNEDEVLAGLDDETRAALVAQRLEGEMDLTEGTSGAELNELLGEDPDRFEEDEEEGDAIPTMGVHENGHA